MSRFREALDAQGGFAVTFELIPARGSRGKGIDAVMDFAREAAKANILDAVSLTDNPGGGPALNPDMLAKEFMEMGLDTIVHFAAKDASRNGLEARALSLDRLGIENLLVMTGDFPAPADRGLSKPVFDLDATHLIRYLKDMNAGIPVDDPRRTTALPAPTGFFIGCVVSPFKPTEPEVMTQYYKLEKKIRAGAEYVVTQVGYDTRKYRELLDYMRMRGLNVPVMGSVFVLTRGAAKVMNCGDVPGCLVTDSLCETVRGEASAASDKGKGAALERAARQIAILKGIGYRGAHIEGFALRFDDARIIVERAREIGDNWREYDGEFRYMPERTYFISEEGKQPEPPKPSFRPRRSNVIFNVMRMAHALIFVKGTPGFAFMRGISAFLERHPFLFRIFYFKERVSKAVLFDCRDCGDCALPETLYLCPESQCPKFQRVGPCGGSRYGKCEVHDDRYCIWYEIYLRAKATGRLDHIRDYDIAPRDWKLHGTSSWTNFYLGRDHTGKDTA